MERLILTHRLDGRAVERPLALEQRNPADPDDLLVSLPDADAALVGEAAALARAALGPIWAMGIEARSDALDAVARALAGRSADIAPLIARETGKTIRDAGAEVGRAARLFQFFAGETLRNIGERFESTRKGASVEVTYDPVGVVGAITPWNFPVAIPAWKIAPALAFGNAVVWKPSELASATAVVLHDILVEAGFGHAVQLVLGGGQAGAALSACTGLDALTFTGSVATGTRIRLAAAERGVALQQEMGGLNGLIVMADADMGVAVNCAMNGAFFAAGQRCTATSRIIVEESVADAFIAALTAATAKLKIGDPRDSATDIGPLAAPRQKETIARGVAAVEAEGRNALFGGTADVRPHSFYAPTLFDHVPADSIMYREEIFGPVAGITRVDGFDAAMEAVNATRFGLSAGICTTSLRHAEAFKRRARAGMTMVNMPTAGADYHAPFGGVGASSHGPREQGRSARSFYTATRINYQAA